MANINKIRVSGTTYNIQDINAPKVIELTQSEYDALTVKDPNAFYVITDSEYNFDGYWTSAQTQNAIAQSVSSKADTSAVTSVSDSLTAHTANTTVHVTAQDKTNWNAKSDFSGNYNDLSNKPTIPSKTSDLTNDSNFATTGDVQTATNDMATKTWVGQQGYLTQHQDISAKQDVSGMTAYTTTATTSALNDVVTAHTANTSIHVSAEQIAAWNAKSDFSGSYNDLTNKLSAGTNVTIVDNVISAEGGGGKAVTGGTNISITTGETADTINCTLPITASTSIRKNDITIGNDIVNGASDYRRLTIGNGNKFKYSSSRTSNSILIGTPDSNSSIYNVVNASSCIGIGGRGLEVGYDNIGAYGSIAIGFGAISNINASVAIGYDTVASGTTKTNINNQLKIDTSNQVYIYNKDNTEMICLQDKLGGGGSTSYSAGTGIDITNDIISVTGKADTSAVTEVSNALTAHTADTTIHVTTAQTAAWDAKSNFSGDYNDLSNKLSAGTGISIVDNVISAEGGGVNVVQTTGTSTADVMSQDAVTTQLNNKANKSAAVGGYKFGSGGGNVYLQYTNVNNSNIGSSLYYPKINGKEILTTNSIYATNNYNFQLVETSAITTAITSSSTDAQVPSAKAVNDKLGGLNLVKLSQSEYDALATKDSNTLYVIVN